MVFHFSFSRIAPLVRAGNVDAEILRYLNRWTSRVLNNTDFHLICIRLICIRLYSDTLTIQCVTIVYQLRTKSIHQSQLSPGTLETAYLQTQTNEWWTCHFEQTTTTIHEDTPTFRLCITISDNKYGEPKLVLPNLHCRRLLLKLSKSRCTYYPKCWFQETHVKTMGLSIALL